MRVRSTRGPTSWPLLAILCALGAQGSACGSGGDALDAPRADAGSKGDASELAGLSETCLDPEHQYTCQPGLTCVPLKFGISNCDYPAQVPPGGCCQEHGDCFPRDLCTPAGCAPNKSGRCSLSPSDSSCARGYVCEAGSSEPTNHCVEAPNPRPLGAPCDGPSQCGTDAYCDQICKVALGENEPCFHDIEDPCRPGLHCQTTGLDSSFSTVCQPRPCAAP
jgi:hypothetical protein